MSYLLQVTDRQLQEIILATEILARLRIGQLDSALNEMLNSKGESRNFSWDTHQQVNEIIKPKLGLSPNESFGVGRFESADRVWDIYEVLRRQMSWDIVLNQQTITQDQHSRKDQSEVNLWSTNYSKPMHWLSTESLPKVKKIPEDDIDTVSRLNEFFD